MGCESWRWIGMWKVSADSFVGCQENCDTQRKLRMVFNWCEYAMRFDGARCIIIPFAFTCAAAFCTLDLASTRTIRVFGGWWQRYINVKSKWIVTYTLHTNVMKCQTRHIIHISLIYMGFPPRNISMTFSVCALTYTCCVLTLWSKYLYACYVHARVLFLFQLWLWNFHPCDILWNRFCANSSAYVCVCVCVWNRAAALDDNGM